MFDEVVVSDRLRRGHRQRARQRRELATRLGFPPTDATVIATAISEIARNIVVHARRGLVLRPSRGTAPRRRGRGDRRRTRDSGRQAAMRRERLLDLGGLGLGLPGARGV